MYKGPIVPRDRSKCLVITDHYENLEDYVYDGSNPIIINTKEKRVKLGNIINTKGNKHKGVGIIIWNCYSSIIDIGVIKNFNIGMMMYSDGRQNDRDVGGKGCVHNRISVMHLENNQHNLDLVAIEQGWTNSNTFSNSRLSHYSDNGINRKDFSHIRFINHSDFCPPDNNHFENLSIEGNTARYFMEGEAKYNVFTCCRWEKWVTPREIKWTGSSNGNVIVGGYEQHRLFNLGRPRCAKMVGMHWWQHIRPIKWLKNQKVVKKQ